MGQDFWHLEDPWFQLHSESHGRYRQATGHREQSDRKLWQLGHSHVRKNLGSRAHFGWCRNRSCRSSHGIKLSQCLLCYAPSRPPLWNFWQNVPPRWQEKSLLKWLLLHKQCCLDSFLHIKSIPKLDQENRDCRLWCASWKWDIGDHRGTDETKTVHGIKRLLSLLHLRNFNEQVLALARFQGR